MAAQWGWTHDQETTRPMALGDRIRALRKQHGWSQAELADRIGTDGGRISRYESGRITPSADALVRLAETFNISIDHLLIDDIPARPLHAPEDALGNRLAAIAELDPDALDILHGVIDALVTKTRLHAISSDSG